MIKNKEHLHHKTNKKLIFHAQQIFQTMIGQQIKKNKNPNWIGSFGRLVRTTPTSTRLEGLLAALDLFTDTSLSARIKETIDLGKVFLLNSQITEGEFAGAMPRTCLNNPELNLELHDPRCSEVRIDYVQHFLSFMMTHHEINQCGDLTLKTVTSK